MSASTNLLCAEMVFSSIGTEPTGAVGGERLGSLDGIMSVNRTGSMRAGQTNASMSSAQLNGMPYVGSLSAFCASVRTFTDIVSSTLSLRSLFLLLLPQSPVYLRTGISVPMLCLCLSYHNRSHKVYHGDSNSLGQWCLSRFTAF